MKNDIDGSVRQYEDGKYRWVYEFDLLRNPTILLVIYKIFFLIGIGEWVLSMLFSLGQKDFFRDGFLANGKTFLIILAVLFGLATLGYAVYALIMRGKYCVLFEMDEDGVRHTQLDSQFKKAKVISMLTSLAGAAAGSPGATGAGILAGARNTMYSEFGSPAKVRAFPGRDTIKIDRTFSHNQIYAEGADFDFVYKYIVSRIPIKATGHESKAKPSAELKSFLRDSGDRLNGKKLLSLILAAANIVLLALIIRGAADNAAGPADTYFGDEFGVQPYAAATEPYSPPPADEYSQDAAENAAPTQPVPAVYSASTPPAPSEFAWFTDEVCRTNQPPEGAVSINDAQSVTGDWKCLILYSPEADLSLQGFAFCNAALSGDAANMTTTFKWNTFVFGGQTIDQRNEANAVFTGSYVGGEVSMSGPGAFRLEHIYELDGKQYAFGHYTPPDGESAMIAMVRP